jgi:hypothetical protein
MKPDVYIMSEGLATLKISVQFVRNAAQDEA